MGDDRMATSIMLRVPKIAHWPVCWLVCFVCEFSQTCLYYVYIGLVRVQRKQVVAFFTHNRRMVDANIAQRWVRVKLGAQFCCTHKHSRVHIRTHSIDNAKTNPICVVVGSAFRASWARFFNINNSNERRPGTGRALIFIWPDDWAPDTSTRLRRWRLMFLQTKRRSNSSNKIKYAVVYKA